MRRYRMLVLSSFAVLLAVLSCKTTNNSSATKSNVDFPKGFFASLKPSLLEVRQDVNSTRQSARKVSQATPDKIDDERKASLVVVSGAAKKLQASIRNVHQRIFTPTLGREVALEASIREEDVRAQVAVLVGISENELPAITDTINTLSVQIAAKQPYIESYDTLLNKIDWINYKVDNVLATFETWIGRFDGSSPDPVPAGAFRDLVTGMDWKTIEQWPGDDQTLNRCKTTLGNDWRIANVFEVGNAASRLSNNTLNKAFTFNPNAETYVSSPDGQNFGRVNPANRQFYTGTNGNLGILCVKQSAQYALQFRDPPIRSLWHWLGQWDSNSSQIGRCSKVLGAGWKVATRSELLNASPRLTDATMNTAFKVNAGGYAYIASPDGSKIGYGQVSNEQFYNGENGFLDIYCIRNQATELPAIWADTVANQQWVTIGKWAGDDTLKDRCRLILGEGWKLPLTSELQNAVPRLINQQLNTAFKINQGEYTYVSMGANLGYMPVAPNATAYNGTNGTLTVLCNSPIGSIPGVVYTPPTTPANPQTPQQPEQPPQQPQPQPQRICAAFNSASVCMNQPVGTSCGTSNYVCREDGSADGKITCICKF